MYKIINICFSSPKNLVLGLVLSLFVQKSSKQELYQNNFPPNFMLLYLYVKNLSNSMHWFVIKLKKLIPVIKTKFFPQKPFQLILILCDTLTSFWKIKTPCINLIKFEKLHAGPISDLFWPKNFHIRFFPKQLFKSVSSLHAITFCQKLETSEHQLFIKLEKPRFRYILAHFDPITSKWVNFQNCGCGNFV